MKAYRIVLADDHRLIRQGLRKIIESGEGLQVVGEAGDGNELITLLRRVEVDLVILDMSMPRLRGLDALVGIRKCSPEIKVLVLSMHKEYVHQALQAGVNGYLLKEDADRELFFAIETLRQGGTFLSPRLSATLSGIRATGPESLSRREEEVLHLIAGGNSNREVAEKLHISVRTVETHRANIMSKMRLRNAADLIRYALQRGLA